MPRNFLLLLKGQCNNSFMTEVDFSATKLQLPKIDDENQLPPRNNLIKNRGTQE